MDPASGPVVVHTFGLASARRAPPGHASTDTSATARRAAPTLFPTTIRVSMMDTSLPFHDSGGDFAKSGSPPDGAPSGSFSKSGRRHTGDATGAHRAPPGDFPSRDRGIDPIHVRPRMGALFPAEEGET